MGNVVASEALRRRGRYKTKPLIHSYVASQAATVAHAYDATGPETVRTDFNVLISTPESYARYWTSGVPYFVGMTNAVRKAAGIPAIFNYHNFQDYALDGWRFNQDTKPDIGWKFSPLTG